MNFYIEGSQIGFSINSWLGSFLLFYFIIEIVFLYSTKMLLIHKLLILPIIVWQIKKMTPRNWHPKSFWNFILINRVSRFRYEFYCEFECKLKIKFDSLINPLFTNDEIIINPFGKIIKSNFVNSINAKSSLLKKIFPKEFNQLNREQSLKDLGI